MTEPLKLIMGVDAEPKSAGEQEEAIRVLRATVEHYLPSFVEAVESEAGVLVLHQDAFAAGYDVDEYTILGMAVKYAGLYGREIHVIGTNRETYREPPSDGGNAGGAGMKPMTRRPRGRR
jgi:hypothetical protein